MAQSFAIELVYSVMINIIIFQRLVSEVLRDVLLLFLKARLRQCIALLLILLLSACATQSAYQAQWREQLPPLDYYVAVYSQDVPNQAVQTQQDYLAWVKRFYSGWVLYPKGWDWLTSSVVSETRSIKARIQLEQDLAVLGRHISAEWAKDAKYRVINNSHLMIWADALKIAVRKDQQAVLTLQIASDVEQLLARSLPPQDIVLERYFHETVSIVVADEFDADDPFEA